MFVGKSRQLLSPPLLLRNGFILLGIPKTLSVCVCVCMTISRQYTKHQIKLHNNGIHLGYVLFCEIAMFVCIVARDLSVALIRASRYLEKLLFSLLFSGDWTFLAVPHLFIVYLEWNSYMCLLANYCFEGCEKFSGCTLRLRVFGVSDKWTDEWRFYVVLGLL